ncbi:MAG TPA: hypothetical protein VFZ59_27285 [Verrucomicrobiae bacterium]|nr:hypothetical protein [Verrucomicrobiae bacterium]
MALPAVWLRVLVVDFIWLFRVGRSLLIWGATACRATPLTKDLTAGLVAVDFIQPLSLRAVFPSAEVLPRRPAKAVPTNPPASAPTVVAPTTLAVRLKPLRLEV